MKHKAKKISVTELSNRLQSDENAWCKQLSSMGDLARYLRQLDAHVKKSERAIKRLQKLNNALEVRIVTLERSTHNHVVN
jgi:hypothetical protein